MIIITGTHLRHRYLAATLCATGLVKGVIFEQRQNLQQAAEDKAGVLPSHLDHLLKHHFAMQRLAEEYFFAEAAQQELGVPTLEIAVEELNGPKVMAFMQKLQPHMVLSYGCHKLSAELMASVPNCRFLNTHGGLSPEYRGTTTHFWPSYFLEVAMTGMTLHETTDKLDGGNILLTTNYELTPDDTLHMVAGRTLKGYTEKLVALLPQLNLGALPSGVKQKNTGKLFLSSDWRPEHLRLIYDFYGDNIVNLTIKGELVGRNPNLIDVLTPAIAIKK